MNASAIAWVDQEVLMVSALGAQRHCMGLFPYTGADQVKKLPRNCEIAL